MSIDMHVHMGSYPSIEQSGEYLRTRADVASFRTRHPEKFGRYVHETPIDNGAALLDVMDRYGVEKSLIQVRPGVDNAFLASIARNHPKRLIPLAVPTPWPTPISDARDPAHGQTPEQAAAELEYCFAELGMRAAGELYPRRVTSSIHPEQIADDLAPLMQVLEQYGASVQIATAWTQFPGGLFYGDPLWVDELANRHPKVPIILTKMGRGLTRYFESSLTVAIRNQNIYLDTSDTTVTHLQEALKYVGPSRILFGTDWSPTWQFLQDPGSVHDNAIDTVTRAIDDASVLEQIFTGNAQALYGNAIRFWAEHVAQTTSEAARSAA